MDIQTLLEKVPESYWPWIVRGGAAMVGLLVLRAIWGRVSGILRRRRPTVINPKLAKYSVDHAELDKKRREAAKKIAATSTGARLAGYKIVRQVEAVFVEGYRSPEESLIALKAAAAERGANGILNVNTDRTAAGRCSASGDAVIVATLQQVRRPSAPAQELPSVEDAAPTSEQPGRREPQAPPPPAPPPPPAESSPPPLRGDSLSDD